MGETLDTRWFDPNRLNLLVGLVLFILFLVINIRRARASQDGLYIRPIAGLKALDEAIGRATEMGRPVLFIPGIGDMSEVGTLAAITISSRVARRVADLGCDLRVPCYDPVVTALIDGTTREAYREANRADSFRPGSVYYVSATQFAYVASVTGTMMRERPAANIYMGAFYAESLFLAETGNQTGAIQIAGCDQVTQLPFFVCSCDYTLLGEELYAASAYLGREPIQLATIAAQDWAKALAAGIIVAAIIMAAFGYPWLGTVLKAS
ncbi:MAG TPA: DUF6754 domain-containing protein [Candidatus Eisenbacteria bacterium]|nr:DUF6754 domain-containing protein [Candidatus Eisenbacteria bacterium]